MRTLIGAVLLSLGLSLTGCAAPSVAVEPALCQHPLVDATTHQGLVQGLLDYHAAIELCNALNGHTTKE